MTFKFHHEQQHTTCLMKCLTEIENLCSLFFCVKLSNFISRVKVFNQSYIIRLVLKSFYKLDKMNNDVEIYDFQV
ncbi:hypothetical protein HanRHA438_Chr16g0759071 [Helianthus annuus]|uniref:Uncharacterized protein n=1 Tax=Helianthus annuus TaxID=4232 RepID=A0A251RNA6_HELAN|nr:hypothetical protein HanXRQr2_Chr16g0747401 [Helianthus annuus]KAJ0438058.1 hypothetical protein HanHA300_Chr16g0609571 [Helianthus annuus]KAJ0460382.1 hypothetical protein HanHA89_Chr16g0660161 [Helianthus annuus]KAJ0821139.1 hypothetical protein HanPSC8_Chr16g0716511 [Helianthus annuus]KAJ0835756.1 hypothetical protein HanRHA438_Chr16g0759071 [Helianthus annuus]